MNARCDIAVVGGGMNGLTAALALSAAGFAVAVVDRRERAAALDDRFDGRVSSIAWGSRLVLERLGAWSAMAERAQPIDEIRVSDAATPFFLHYDHAEVGDHPVGWTLENRFLRRALDASVPWQERVRSVTGEVVGIECGRDGAVLTLGDATRIRCRLIVACDGAASPLRAMASISAWRHAYRQTGIVCTVAPERPHRGIAHERFLSSGPFAILPMPDDLVSLVWTERDAIAARVLELDRAAFLEEIAWRFGDFLGRLELTGPVWSHPLELVLASRLTDRRLVLLGDAAHAIHPIAGQGYNLGIRDAAVLAEVLADGRRLGLEPGDAVLLDDYARRRRTDTVMLTAVTHALNRMFSNRIAPLALARGLGLAAVQRIGPLRRLFMRDAMGVVGSLPRLMRGEEL